MMTCNKAIDIKTFASINSSRSYFLDTNVLYWYVYPRYNTVKTHTQHQAMPYYDFVDKLVSDGNPLYTSIYNITELLHVVEKNEYDIYQTTHPDLPLTIKDYRKIDAERGNLKRILTTTMSNIKNICTILDFNFTQTILDEFLNSLDSHRCDTFDYAILRNCIAEKQLNVISDDSDFATMELINLYTANATVLSK